VPARFLIGPGKKSRRREASASCPLQRGSVSVFPHPQSTRAPRDLARVAIVSVLFAALSIRFELSEQLLAWTQPQERFQLDELPGILLVVACGLLWFAWRRMRDARAELHRRLRAEADLRKALLENRRLAQAHVDLQERERRGLARELHDELGQCLNAIKLDAVAIGAAGARPEDVRSATASIIELSDGLQAVVRDMLRRLRPPGLDELGLVAALTHCIDGWRRRMPGVRYCFEAPPHDDGNWGESVNIALYRLVQEGLTNVARHADADCVSIELACPGATGAEKEVVLTMRNNGTRRDGVGVRPGLGLLGMRERIAALGGTLTVRVDPPGAFHLEARVPVGRAVACTDE
jgi:two-component system, NarL family, sensor histidine kinase UhpB